MGGKEDGNAVPELATDASTGFFFLSRASKLEMLERTDVELSQDEQGGMVIICIRHSETDQSGQCMYRALRTSGGGAYVRRAGSEVGSIY